MSEREEVPWCECDPSWPGASHEDTCPVAVEITTLRQRVLELEAAVMGVNEELERERLRLAACGVAARGESRSVNTIYTSDSLKAVVCLHTRAENAERERDEARRERDKIEDERDHWHECYKGAAVGLTEWVEECLKWNAERDTLRHRADRAERECERMREVVEAARAQSAKVEEWLSCTCPPDCPHDLEYDRATIRTESAVRALNAAEGTPGA